MPFSGDQKSDAPPHSGPSVAVLSLKPGGSLEGHCSSQGDNHGLYKKLGSLLCQEQPDLSYVESCMI